MKFTEQKLELAFIELLKEEQIFHTNGSKLKRTKDEVLLKEDLESFLLGRYKKENLIKSEVEQIIRKLEVYSATDLYDSNREIINLITNGFTFKREDSTKQDIYIELIDYNEVNRNSFRFVNQLEIKGYEVRIPDGIVYVNGLPLVGSF